MVTRCDLLIGQPLVLAVQSQPTEALEKRENKRKRKEERRGKKKKECVFLKELEALWFWYHLMDCKEEEEEIWRTS